MCLIDIIYKDKWMFYIFLAQIMIAALQFLKFVTFSQVEEILVLGP
jgi:hypothetical protein